MTPHCWHLTSTYNAGGFEGYEREICCFCGSVRFKNWTSDIHPSHGSYYAVRTKTWTMKPSLEEQGNCRGQEAQA